MALLLPLTAHSFYWDLNYIHTFKNLHSIYDFSWSAKIQSHLSTMHNCYYVILLEKRWGRRELPVYKKINHKKIMEITQVLTPLFLLPLPCLEKVFWNGLSISRNKNCLSLTARAIISFISRTLDLTVLRANGKKWGAHYFLR